jgi:hypothetical protein
MGVRVTPTIPSEWTTVRAMLRRRQMKASGQVTVLGQVTDIFRRGQLQAPT